MGAKAWFVAYYNCDPKEILRDGPKLDRAASLALAKRLLPGIDWPEGGEGSLDFLNPNEGEVFVGDYGDLKIVAHLELGADRLSEIDPRWHNATFGSTVYVHAMHSMVDFFAFAVWKDGTLVRSLSVSPDSGVMEDIGAKLPFEMPYWEGQHSVETEEGEEPYPLPFDPLELAEQSLLAHLGFQFEGNPDEWACDPMNISILHLGVEPARREILPKRQNPWWKFW
ncbi:MAG: hypothetical protein KDE08_00680 [Rhodobacteraceae bacterium]|nr:hypothetical protein [Paracoccaceae bacterium]